jgi:hypothetical protein
MVLTSFGRLPHLLQHGGADMAGALSIMSSYIADCKNGLPGT